jgi:glutamate/tyrosine decarboxylase-like PLP-dependent enzyme
VPVQADYSIDVQALLELVRTDRALGLHPIAVIGTAGTVNTGATDDLVALADVCAKEDLWLHVDGAFGALAALSPKLKRLVHGIELADSVAFDLHKWMFLPFEAACLLVRDGQAHKDTFATRASYISDLKRGPAAGGFPFADLGLELTRGFKALKAWMSIKAYGIRAFAELIEQNVEQARYLAGLIEAEPELELLAPVPLNIVCFRYRFKGVEPERWNGLNLELLLRIQEQGLAVPSSTVLEGRFAIRACVLNHRTRREDLEGLVAAAVSIGREIA